MEDSQISGKGSGSTGCLLTGSLQDQKQFVRMQLDFKVKDIAVSGSFVICLAQNNQLFFWGSLNNKIIQKPLFIHDQVLQIRSGWNHFLFTTKQGLFGMGSNCNLELGVQTAAKYVLQPMLLREGIIQKFACGFRQSYAIIGDSLQGCGESRKFELGVSQKSPQKWIPLWQIKKTNAQVVDMCCGKRFLLILTEDGKVWALGNNEQNVFKHEVTHTIVPTALFQGIRQIAAGWAHIVLLDNHSRIYTFGRNNLGQLGRSQTEYVPVQLQKQEQVTKIVSGTEFSFGVTNRGKIFGWGWNEHANISSCGTTVLAVPKLVQSAGKCKQIWTHCATTIIETECQKL